MIWRKVVSVYYFFPRIPWPTRITHNNFQIGDFNGKLRLHTESVTELNMKYELNVPLHF